MKHKSEYKDMWVFIQHDGTAVEPVSLELCCETRKLCDASGEDLVAVIVGKLISGVSAVILALIICKKKYPKTSTAPASEVSQNCT